ncbi:MAG: FkbM family methyltransferase [Candidatus Shapirobacteria bacterium]|nr:FkbM family methyltransferase [Candidatus Shapirobacteria bacterium]
MIQKIVFNIFFGFKGILLNKYISKKQKFFLLVDYIKFIFLLFFAYFFKKNIYKTRINSFNYTVYFENYITFFYLFNEIFCKVDYLPVKVHNYYDIGSNIGLTILWYKYFNPTLKVYAFEPDPKNYKNLNKNIKINHLDNVVTFPIALSDQKGLANFYVIHDNIQNLDSGLTLNLNLPHKCFKVKTDKLSKYITKNIDLLKIDIEGAEYIVFNDLFINNKIKYIKNIIFEAHFFNQIQKNTLEHLIVKLKKTGHIKKLENSQHTKVFSYHRV